MSFDKPFNGNQQRKLPSVTIFVSCAPFSEDKIYDSETTVVARLLCTAFRERARENAHCHASRTEV